MAEPREPSRPGAVPEPRLGDPAHEVTTCPGQDTALDCSASALSGALHRLAKATDPSAAAAAATEAVWWATAVDAALARRHPAAYARALGSLDPAARKAVEMSFAGFRFVRTQLGPAADPGDFIQPEPGKPRSRAWTWASYPPPVPRRGGAREVSPYREYRRQLAGKLVQDTLKQASGFLTVARAEASGSSRQPVATPG